MAGKDGDRPVPEFSRVPAHDAIEKSNTIARMSIPEAAKNRNGEQTLL
jgi:hypothetical protein